LVSSVTLLEDGTERVLCSTIAARAQSMTPPQRSAAVGALVALASGRRTFDEAVDSLVAESDGPSCFPLLRYGDRARWRGEDWVNFLWASSAVGDFATALSIEPDVPASLFLDPDLAHLMRANLAWARCNGTPAPPSGALLSFIDQMSAAAKYWRERAPAVPRTEIANRYESFSYCVAAKCDMLLERLDEAAICLEAAAATPAGLQPLGALLWGDLLAAKGDLSGARAKWAVAASSRQAKLGGFLAREIALRDSGDES
jgi:hypothetical protein